MADHVRWEAVAFAGDGFHRAIAWQVITTRTGVEFRPAGIQGSDLPRLPDSTADTLVKVVDALGVAGVELFSGNVPSVGAGRGIRLNAVSVKSVRQKSGAAARWLVEGNDNAVAHTNG
jgi:hypothetical protein